MNRIVFSTDRHPMYAWFCPLASLAWQHVAGFKPLVIMVGPVHPWIVDKTRETGADVVEIDNSEGVPSGSMAQFCRVFAYLLGGIIGDDDYLMTVDSDAFPCQGEIFQPSGKDLDAIFPAGMPYSDPPMLPMGYVGMKARLWREVIGFESGSIEESVKRVLDEDPGVEHRRLAGYGDPLHNYDETFLARKIFDVPGLFQERARLVPRLGGIPHGRIDRAQWPRDPDPAGMIDAHLLRPGWTDEVFPRIYPLFAKLVPDKAEWARVYRAEWLERHHD